MGEYMIENFPPVPDEIAVIWGDPCDRFFMIAALFCTDSAV